MAPKLSCAKVRLQYKRKKLASSTSNEPTPALKPLPSLPGMPVIEDSENVLPSNPFAKNSHAKANTLINSSFSLPFSNEPKKSGFMNDDFLQGLQKPKVPTDQLVHNEETDATVAKSPIIVDKSLKTRVVIESVSALAQWQTEWTSPETIHRHIRSWDERHPLLYFRYPESPLPAQQKKLIHKAINIVSKSSGKESTSETLTWYRQFSHNWKLALASALEGLRMGTLYCFYYLQDGMSVLFEKDPENQTLRAYMRMSSLALMEDFKKYGIKYSFVDEDPVKEAQKNESLPEPSIQPKDKNDSESEEDDEEEEVEENESSPATTTLTVKKAPVRFTKRDIVLEGALCLAELIDFLINQTGGHSFAILPEIIAPGPFLFGTLQKNELTYAASCRTVTGQSVCQLRLSGVIFPRNLQKMLQLIDPHEKIISSLTQDRHESTDFLSRFQENKQ